MNKEKRNGHAPKSKNEDMSLATYTGVLSEEDPDIDRELLDKNYADDEVKRTFGQRVEYVWRNVAISVIFNAIFVYGLFHLFGGYIPFRRVVQVVSYGLMIQFGVNVGAHRLWAHRSFKARLPLKLWLLFCQTAAGQNSVYEWVRDHRVHHKFTETDADPHNIKRGFFFAHMGWLLCKKHPDVKRKGKLVDLSDLEADPYIMWQHKYYPILASLLVIMFPTFLFQYIWDSTLWESFCYAGVTRYMLALHSTWLVNSYAHYYGNKPYDKSIRATDSLWFGCYSLGEGWHNYHHVFPWDYKSSEFHIYRRNLGAAFIDMCAWLGLAYDLKTVDPEIIRKRVIRTGDGTHHLWGWGDKDISDDHIRFTVRLHPSKNKVI